MSISSIAWGVTYRAQFEISLQLGCAVIADIVTTFFLVYYLNKSRTGIQRRAFLFLSVSSAYPIYMC